MSAGFVTRVGMLGLAAIVMMIASGCTTTPPKTAALPPPALSDEEAVNEPLLISRTEATQPPSRHGEDGFDPLAFFKERNQCAVEVNCEGGICRNLNTTNFCTDKNIDGLTLARSRRDAKPFSYIPFASYVYSLEYEHKIQIQNVEAISLRKAVEDLLNSEEVWEDIFTEKKIKGTLYWSLAGKEGDKDKFNSRWQAGVFATKWRSTSEKLLDDTNSLDNKPDGFSRKIVIKIHEAFENINDCGEIVSRPDSLSSFTIRYNGREEFSYISNWGGACENIDYFPIKKPNRVSVECWRSQRGINNDKNIAVYGVDLKGHVDKDNVCTDLIERAVEVFQQWVDFEKNRPGHARSRPLNADDLPGTQSLIN